jgi:hypothetical protein
MATAMLAAFSNITLTDGVRVFGAVLDRNVETMGEYGLTGERRMRIQVLRSDSSGFTGGKVLQADPATYSVDELLAMDRNSWTLDRLADDDGIVVSWWLK